MATRPDSSLEECTLVTRTVETSTTVTVGCMVKDGNADHECQPCAATTDLPIGIVVAIGGYTGVTAGAAGDKVTIALLGGGGVVPVKTGGTATRGQSAKYAASGGLVGDCTPTATASTPVVVWSPGYFTQSGSSGDIVGLALCRHYLTEE
jgi:hypothetical protein